MLYFSLFSLIWVVGLVAGSPSPTEKGHLGDGRNGRDRCLSDREARMISAVDRTVTDDFSIEDETINFFFPRFFPLNGPYAVGKAAFKTTLATRPPGVTINSFDVILIVHDCDTVAFRWQLNAVNSGEDPSSTQKAGSPVVYKGIDILEIQKKTLLIQKTLSSADWFRSTYQTGAKICYQKDAPAGPLCADPTPACPA